MRGTVRRGRAAAPLGWGLATALICLLFSTVTPSLVTAQTPPPADVTLAVAPTAAREGEEIALSALVVDAAGSPVPGVEVRFLPGILVTPNREAPIGVTGEDGVARLRLVVPPGSGPGETVVAAIVGSLADRTVVRILPPVAVIELTADPASVRVGDATVISLRVLDAAGDPAAGTAVQVSSDLMRVDRAEGPDTVLVQTGDDGRAEVTFVGTGPGFAVVRAEAGAVSTAIDVEVLAPVLSVSLEVDPVDPSVGDLVTATALVVDAEGRPVPDVEVRFAAEGLELRSESALAITGSDGAATVEYEAASAGEAHVTAAIPGDSADATLSVSGTGGFPVLPVVGGGAALALVVAGGALTWRRRRGGQEREEEQPDRGPSAEVRKVPDAGDQSVELDAPSVAIRAVLPPAEAMEWAEGGAR